MGPKAEGKRRPAREDGQHMDPFLKLGLTLFLVALNGFFVAAEFAFVRVRQTRIAELVERGVPAARVAQSLLGRLDTYLSATQLGVTLASLALGAIGEPAMATLLQRLFYTPTWPPAVMPSASSPSASASSSSRSSTSSSANFYPSGGSSRTPSGRRWACRAPCACS